MFESIKEAWRKRKFINTLIDDFYKEHGNTLPKFSPQGQPLEWKVFVYQEGEHDIYTGKQSGDYKVGITQECPNRGIMWDRQVYGYDINTKKLIEIRGCEWH